VFGPYEITAILIPEENENLDGLQIPYSGRSFMVPWCLNMTLRSGSSCV